MKDMLHVNGSCEILGKIINIRQLQILIHSCTKFTSAWTKEIDFRTWVLIWFFSFFFGIASIMIGLAQIVFQVWAYFSFCKEQNREINTSLRKRYNLLTDNSHMQETFI